MNMTIILSTFLLKREVSIRQTQALACCVYEMGGNVDEKIVLVGAE